LKGFSFFVRIRSSENRMAIHNFLPRTMQSFNIYC
jgi:hypothetical protein